MSLESISERLRGAQTWMGKRVRYLDTGVGGTSRCTPDGYIIEAPWSIVVEGEVCGWEDDLSGLSLRIAGYGQYVDAARCEVIGSPEFKDGRWSDAP